MAVEIKSNTDVVRWPAGIRLPVMLTFEHQAGEGAPLFAGERPNYMVGGAMQYGARRGIWNILELLEKYKVKATFFVLGATAEKYPETVQAAAKAGHEIAGMGYSFASIRTASEEARTRQCAPLREGSGGYRGRQDTWVALSRLSR